MSRSISPLFAVCVAFLGAASTFLPSSAAALDLDVAGVLLLGTGVDTGDAENNPYQLQFGGAGELTINGFVVGVRGTRSVGSDDDCSTPGCARVNDLRTIGGDFGFDWEFLLLHISPRFGVGQLKERDDGSRVAMYLEPGGVAEVELGWITLGADLRYRIAVDESDANGFLAYFRGGLRF
jgi:hypothetical protein